jgi:hypothetical protein
MAAILDRLISQLKDRGMSDREAYRIASNQMQKSGNIDSQGNATPKGIQRGNMSPGERAKDRSAKQYGGSPDDYIYNPKNNSAVKSFVNFNVKPRK